MTAEPQANHLYANELIQTRGKDLNAPSGDSFLDIGVSGSDNATSFPTYFEDRTARTKEKYKYVIYVYDANDKYSYPIEIYASLNDELSIWLVE